MSCPCIKPGGDLHDIFTKIVVSLSDTLMTLGDENKLCEEAMLSVIASMCMNVFEPDELGRLSAVIATAASAKAAMTGDMPMASGTKH